jgi:hypothetical protein
VSRPADPSRQLHANAEDSGDRLVPDIRVSKRMKSFVNRMRPRLKALDLTDPDAVRRLDQAQEDMSSILKKKKIL